MNQRTNGHIFLDDCQLKSNMFAARRVSTQVPTTTTPRGSSWHTLLAGSLNQNQGHHPPTFRCSRNAPKSNLDSWKSIDHFEIYKYHRSLKKKFQPCQLPIFFKQFLSNYHCQWLPSATNFSASKRLLGAGAEEAHATVATFEHLEPLRSPMVGQCLKW